MPATGMTIRNYGAITLMVMLGIALAAAIAAAWHLMSVEDRQAPVTIVIAGTFCLWIALLILWFAKDVAVAVSIDETGLTLHTLLGRRPIPWRTVRSIRSADPTKKGARFVYTIKHTDGTLRVVLPYKEQKYGAALALIHRYWADEHGISPYARESPEEVRASARRGLRVSAGVSLACFVLILTAKLLGLLESQWTWVMIFAGPAVMQVIALCFAIMLYVAAWGIQRELDNRRPDLDAQCALSVGTVRAAAWRRYWAHHPRGPLTIFLLSMLALGGFYAAWYWMVRTYGRGEAPEYPPMLVAPAVAVIIMDAVFVLGQYADHRTYVKNYRKEHKEKEDATE